ncbi:MAG: GGDEF domain-containing protein [Glaciimonas sp.]|nr:GGDEF domain-containing protein [Glaciimonas sp.]
MTPERLNKSNVLTLHMLAWVLLSCGFDALLLAGFAHEGLIAGRIVWLYVVLSLALNGTYYLFIKSGFNSKLKDPSMTFLQLVVAALMQIGFLILAPEVGYLFLINLFAVYAFGMLRLTTGWYLVSWLIGAFALGFAFQLVGIEIGLPITDSVTKILVYLSFILVLARCMVIANMLSRMRQRLSSKNAKLRVAMQHVQKLATRDALTNIENRRSLTEILAVEQKRFQRSGSPFCIAILDLDSFKVVNDSLGHAIGDEVLKAFVQIARSQMRLSDHFARYGGDEFVLVLTDTTVADGMIPLQRICDETAQYNWRQFGYDSGVTTSVGVTDFRVGETIASAFQRADNAMYAAKAAGRNRVVASENSHLKSVDKIFAA